MKIRPVAAFAPILVMLAACQPSAEDNASDAAAPSGNTASQQPVPDVVAQADLAATDGTPRGMARVTRKPGGLVVNVQASGMAPGQYGLHVHSVGTCAAPDFKTAEGHWNPTGAQHGFDNPAGPHLGDLPNLTIGADGKGIVDFSLAGATVAGLFDSDGSAIVVHAGPDDLKTDPSGDSGARIACGVLRAP